jgi:hypothetical protein
MTTSEILLEMENLWDKLCRKAEEVPTPDWHEKILDLREKDIAQGREDFINWDDAKNKIRKSVK